MFKKFIFLHLFFIVALNASASTPADLYLKKARETSSKEEKIKNYSVAFKLNPQLSSALLERARVFFSMNKIGEASDDLEMFEKRFTPDSEFFLLKGMIAQRNGLLDKADELFDNALKLNGNNNEALLRKGILLVTLGQLRNSSANFLAAAKLLSNIRKGSKQYIIALSQAAKCYEFTQDYQKTLSTYDTLVNESSGNSSHHFNFGRLLYMNENHEQALEELKQAAKLSISEGSNKLFYAALAYYIEVKIIKNKVSADYWLKRIRDQISNDDLLKLFLLEITPENYMENIRKLSESNNYSTRRKNNLQAESLCHLGYFHLLSGDNDKAFSAFKQVTEKGSFGAYYFYLSRYEAQKMDIIKDLEKKEKLP